MKYYLVDAFADALFTGNPAGVCLVEQPLDEATMQSIAAENNLSETAYISKAADGFDLRWFTPLAEVDLCGHATLASSFVVANFVDPALETIRFHTKSGLLTVVKKGDLFEMDFPTRPPQPIAVTPEMQQVFGRVLEAHSARDLLLVLESEQAVRELQPDFALVAQLFDHFGVTVTAKGEQVDFVSRFFAPRLGVPEDPVTGSAHSTLIPFWAGRLGKEKMVAQQISKRGGTLHCQLCGDRVKIAGKAALYLSGEIHL